MILDEKHGCEHPFKADEELRKQIEEEVKKEIAAAENCTWHGLIEKSKNFYWDFNRFITIAKEEDEYYYLKLYVLYESIIEDIDERQESSDKQSLNTFFERIFAFVVDCFEDFEIFDEFKIRDDVFDACFFFALCMFINQTKRTKSSSLRKFVYDHSPSGYSLPGHSNYFDPKYTKIDSEKGSILTSEEATLRKERNRILSKREVYNKSIEWAAMTANAEHEWTFYYKKDDLAPDLKDTLKRIGNLYTDIDAVMKLSSEDVEYYYKKESAYGKFLSKLKKIKYESYLELLKAILSHICENKQYYGINIYRFERRLKLYSTTNRVNRLLECKVENEEKQILAKSAILNGIEYPQLYYDFSTFTDEDAYKHANRFLLFKETIAVSSCLILDVLIEKGYFGDDWETLFLDTINGMTERVFYDPEKIDYTVKPESQGKFEKLLSKYVRVRLGL